MEKGFLSSKNQEKEMGISGDLKAGNEEKDESYCVDVYRIIRAFVEIRKE